MNNKPRTALIIFFEALFLFLFFLIQFSVSPILKIGNSFPDLLLCLVLTCSFFFGSVHGSTVGFVSGLLIDSVVSGSTCFYTIFMLLAGLVAGLLKEHFLNSNFRAAMAVNLIFSLVYYFTRWVFFHAFFEGFGYFIRFSLPCFIYTSIIFIPVYLLFRLINIKAVTKL